MDDSTDGPDPKSEPVAQATTVEPPPRRLPREAWWAIAAGAALAAAVAVVVSPRILGADDTPPPSRESNPKSSPTTDAAGYDPDDPFADFPLDRDALYNSWYTYSTGGYVPQTGETWHDPVEIPDPGNLLVPMGGDWDPAIRYYSVGSRGSSDIVVAYTDFDFVYAFEIDASGHGSLLPCLSATDFECQAIGPYPAYPHPDLSVRPDIAYESLSYPAMFQFAGEYYIGLPWQSGSSGEWQGGGPYMAATLHTNPGGWDEPADAQYTPLVEFGGTTILEMKVPSALPGYTSLDYVVLTPLGRAMLIPGWNTTGGDFGQIQWTDAADSEDFSYGSEGATSPGSTTCTMHGSFAIDANHQDSLWYAAGTTGNDTVVYLPTDANPLPEQVRRLHFDSAWNQGTDNPGEGTGGESDVDPYPYRTEQQFRDAKALWAFERPDGVWLIAMRPTAVADVYECL